MAGTAPERAEELELERAQLLKSEGDIRQGRQRLQRQEGLLLELQADRHDTKQAERLVELMKATLVEWERHHVMIVARIAYLESAPHDG